MISRSARRVAAVLTAACVLGAPAASAEPLQALATFSIIGDFVANVGGARVEVTTLVGRNGDAHVYTPKPADARLVNRAKVVFTNGLGFEGWINRLIKASGTTAPVVVVSEGVRPRKETAGKHKHGHSHGDVDPHAWQSIASVRTYVANIRKGLVSVDPAGRDLYEANAAAYLVKLDALEEEVRKAIAVIPPERRKVITSHDAFGYFAAAYGIEFIAPQGVSTESEVSARDLARIIGQIKKQRIPAVFLENVTDPRLMNRIAAESGVAIGGKLYSDALTETGGEAPTYIDMIRHNIRTLTAALGR